VLVNRPVRPALNAGRVGWYHRPLDADRMRVALAQVVGTHDFSAFRAAECQAKSPVKTLARAAVVVDGDILRFDFSADAFLHHMIRNLVGALVHVGVGREAPEWLGALLAGRDRARAAPTFMPDGLHFCGADYDARFGLPPTRRPVVVASA
jgi:tRNA pseudouridine38-40 synthase